MEFLIHSDMSTHQQSLSICTQRWIEKIVHPSAIIVDLHQVLNRANHGVHPSAIIVDLHPALNRANYGVHPSAIIVDLHPTLNRANHGVHPSAIIVDLHPALNRANHGVHPPASTGSINNVSGVIIKHRKPQPGLSLINRQQLAYHSPNMVTQTTHQTQWHKPLIIT